MTQDTRVVYGARCTFWGDIANVALRTEMRLPCCPYCKGMLFEYATEEEFITLAEKLGTNYVEMVKLHKNKKCYPTFTELIENYNNTVEESKRITSSLLKSF